MDPYLFHAHLDSGPAINLNVDPDKAVPVPVPLFTIKKAKKFTAKQKVTTTPYHTYCS